MDFQPIFISIASAVIYSLIWYCRTVIDPTKPTPEYDFWQLGATILVGAFVGALSVFSGVEITQGGLETQLAAYGFIIAAVEQVGKALVRNFDVSSQGAT